MPAETDIDYLEDAERLLHRGDSAQASGKLWEAVAEMVKSVAEARGWRHSGHRELRQTVERLFQETADAELIRLFAIAESLEANGRENWLWPETVKLFAEDARRLIEKLRPFASTRR